jgi:hypothetical protein
VAGLAKRRALGLQAVAAVLLLAGCAAPGGTPVPEIFEARLDGAQEVPSVPTPATGAARVQLDAHGVMRWTVRYEGLSGPLTGAHVHGPAGPGQDAPILIPLAPAAGAATLSGQVRLTPEQVAQLASGQWYVNLHTARHPGGEIRGQLRPPG